MGSRGAACRIKVPLECRPLATVIDNAHRKMVECIKLGDGERGMPTDINISASILSWNMGTIEQASILESDIGSFNFQTVCRRAGTEPPHKALTKHQRFITPTVKSDGQINCRYCYCVIELSVCLSFVMSTVSTDEQQT